MQTARIGQAVVLVMILAAAAGCAASKEYTSKLFTPRTPGIKDSQATVLRFLELDNTDTDKENWVSTDIIMGRDTVSKTLALDKFSKVFPAAAVNNITTNANMKPEQAKTAPAVVPPAPAESEPVAKNANPGEVRTKRTRE